MAQINLQNYKIIYEFAEQCAQNYNNSRPSLGAAWSSAVYSDLLKNRDNARHLFIRRMNEFISDEKMGAQISDEYVKDLEIKLFSEEHLIEE